MDGPVPVTGEESESVFFSPSFRGLFSVSAHTPRVWCSRAKAKGNGQPCAKSHFLSIPFADVMCVCGSGHDPTSGLILCESIN